MCALSWNRTTISRSLIDTVALAEAGETIVLRGGVDRGTLRPRSDGVTVRIHLPLALSTARALCAGKDLPARRAAGGGVEVLVPRVEIHEVLSLELSS